MKNNILIYLIKKIKIPKFLIFWAMLISIIGTIIGLAIPIYTGKVVDQISNVNMNLILILIFIFISSSILEGVGIYLLSKSGEIIIYYLRLDLWEHLIFLKMDFFDDNESGKLMSRVIEDTNIINTFVSERLPSVIPSLITLIGAIIMLLLLDWQMTLLTFVTLPILLIIIIPLSNKVENISIKNQNEAAIFNSLLSRVLTNILLVKTTISEKIEIENASKNLRNLYDLGLKEAKIKSIITPIVSVVMLCVIATILGFGGYRVSNNIISSGTLVAMIFYVFQLTSPILSFSLLFTDYKKCVGASKRIYEIYQKDQEKNLGFKNNIEDDKYNISFKNVYFSYNNSTLIEDISFEANFGEITAIVGPSGSGKTTIFKLIERIYDIQYGEISINNIDIRELNIYSLRKNIGYVSQENLMMAGSIKDNLLYGLNNKLSEKNIQKSLDLSNSTKFVSVLSDGLNTNIGENGLKLSGGQKQRIDIARVLLRNPKILLLDEITSNLDSESESNIQRVLESLKKEYTTLIIAHRLSTIKKADKIIFIDDGKVTGVGTHNYLINNHQKYYEYVKQQ